MTLYVWEKSGYFTTTNKQTNKQATCFSIKTLGKVRRFELKTPEKMHPNKKASILDGQHPWVNERAKVSQTKNAPAFSGETSLHKKKQQFLLASTYRLLTSVVYEVEHGASNPTKRFTLGCPPAQNARTCTRIYFSMGIPYKNLQFATGMLLGGGTTQDSNPTWRFVYIDPFEVMILKLFFGCWEWKGLKWHFPFHQTKMGCFL